ncbi:MAG: thiamine biosynthesis protein ThiF [Frankiaceae bacterium]|nr:thiamine biosynthesis protein ThiF [Frankiaceae bacterium]
MRPLLTPTVRRLWRDPETLQLGRPPGRAVVLAGVDSLVRGVLGLLDGTRDRAGLVRAAADSGCPPERTEEVLSLLAHACLLDDAAADRGALAGLGRPERDRLAADLGSLRLVRGDDALIAVGRRRSARVVVDGAGRVGATVAALLAASGVGIVDVVDDGLTRPEDCGIGGLPPTAVGRPRAQATRDLLTAVAGQVSAGADHVAFPDLLVLAPPAGFAVPEPPRLVPHLLAEVRGDVGVVGPLVTAGTSACLRCLDLTRADRDPGWPAIAVQLATPARDVAPCDTALAVAVAAQTAMQALAFLDGAPRPGSVGGTLELVLPDWRWRRRSWQVHPDCDCGWRDAG